MNFRFAILSDPHIALPETIWDHPSRFHLVEISIPVFEFVIDQLAELDLDFLLIPGDLTQHGERENHTWLANRLAKLPYPVYVVPGNHDVLEVQATERAIAAMEFPQYYQKFGYTDPQQIYYTQEILPGVRLIGLNSNFFDQQGKQIGMGRIDAQQMQWLQQVLAEAHEPVVMVMVHHNLIEHLPGQSKHGMGRRYMTKNAQEVLTLLEQAGVQMIFTGHLHVQDIARRPGISEITTGSLVSYPHPYRVLQFQEDGLGRRWLQVESGQVGSVPGWEDLGTRSREWMGDRSVPFMMRLLTDPPLSLPPEEAQPLVKHLKYFWADIASGDQVFDFPDFPPAIRRYFNRFSAVDGAGHLHFIDNHSTLLL